MARTQCVKKNHDDRFKSFQCYDFKRRSRLGDPAVEALKRFERRWRGDSYLAERAKSGRKYSRPEILTFVAHRESSTTVGLEKLLGENPSKILNYLHILYFHSERTVSSNSLTNIYIYIEPR